MVAEAFPFLGQYVFPQEESPWLCVSGPGCICSPNSSEGCGSVFLPSCAMLYVSLSSTFGLKALVLTWVTWLHFLSLCAVSGLYGFSWRTCVSVFMSCLLESWVWVMMSQSHR